MLEIVKNATSWKSILTKNNLVSIANFARDAYSEGMDTFKEAQLNARISGKMLGHFLA